MSAPAPPTGRPQAQGSADTVGADSARVTAGVRVIHRAAWLRNLRWIAGLLAIWFVVTFVVSWYARELVFPFFGWPFSYWVGAQGALIVYVLMAALYAWRMNRLDDEIADDVAHMLSEARATNANADPGEGGRAR
jgi:putative solute:sodium symporter small subunit